jgi:hypothetical protein
MGPWRGGGGLGGGRGVLSRRGGGFRGDGVGGRGGFVARRFGSGGGFVARGLGAAGARTGFLSLARRVGPDVLAPLRRGGVIGLGDIGSASGVGRGLLAEQAAQGGDGVAGRQTDPRRAQRVGEALRRLDAGRRGADGVGGLRRFLREQRVKVHGPSSSAWPENTISSLFQQALGQPGGFPQAIDNE